MTRQTIYTICAFLLLGIATVGTTYAFYSASASSNNNSVAAVAQKFEILYTGGTDIEGPLNLSVDRTGGVNTTVHIKVGEGSSHALAYLFLNISEMSEVLSTTHVKWEVSGVKGGKEVYTNQGTFNGYNAGNNNIITIVEDYRLTEEQTDFTLYIWIDGNNVGNEVLGAYFKGYISASTEQFTGQLG